jgi:hypothetical protein
MFAIFCNSLKPFTNFPFVTGPFILAVDCERKTPATGDKCGGSRIDPNDDFAKLLISMSPATCDVTVRLRHLSN